MFFEIKVPSFPHLKYGCLLQNKKNYYFLQKEPCLNLYKHIDYLSIMLVFTYNTLGF